MPTINPKRSCSGSRNGVALLAVLACILLLTILVVSFISFTKLNRVSTAEYSNAVQAQEIAQGGFQDILGDLHAEIVAGSTNNAAYTVNGTSIYVPATNLTAVPARIGYVSTSWATNFTATALSPTLVRVSRATGNPNAVGGDAFFTQIAANTGPYTNNIAAVPGGTILNRASQVSTALSSVNGRAISAARWNKTFLLSTNSTTVPSVFTSAPPDWVYVTQTGSRVCTASELGTSPGLLPSSNLTQNYGTITPGYNPPVSPVVGRYAYVVYDEGALLDANVAGSPSTLMNAGTVQISSSGTSTPDSVSGRTLTFAGKSYESFADLYQLPGLNTTAGQTAINNFITLRNAGGIASSNYLNSLFQYANYSFTSFLNNGGSTPISDTPFVSRQDLINYFANIDSNINTSSATFSQALPYLGTFSRAVSAPTYFPPLDPSAITNYQSSMVTASPAPTYHTSMETTGVANRDLANVRYLTAATITHFYDDQTGTATPTGTITYSVNQGDPLVQNRFSLARINWLSSHTIGGADPGTGANPATGAGPSVNFATAIQACFGLQWGTVGANANGGNPCWKYIGSKNNFSGTLETLDQVAAEGREPNFFELLKAAILSGSLGLSPGKAMDDNARYDYPGYYFAEEYPSYASVNSFNAGSDNYYGLSFGPAAGSPPAPWGVTDMQIMKIGADIIDQYDADSYPTAIYFPYQALQGQNADAASSSYSGAFGSSDMVYGEENLPDLAGVVCPACTTDGTAPTGTLTSPLGSWWQPELWNPHQQPNAVNSAAPPPTQFIVQAYGGSELFCTDNTYSPATRLDGQAISITLSSGTPTTAFYASPYLLTQSSIPGVSSVSASVAGGSPAASNGVTAASMLAKPVMNGYAANPFVGFSMGIDTNYTANGDEYYAYGEPLATFCLGWSANGTDFHPYSYMTGIFGSTYGKNQYVTPTAKITASSADITPGPGMCAAGHYAVDPRTNRLPTFAQWGGFQYPGTDLWPQNSSGGPTGRSSAGVGWGVPFAYLSQNTPVDVNFVYYDATTSNITLAEDWLINSANPTGQSGATATYYADPDGVVRPGDGLNGNASTGDGMILYINNAASNPPSAGLGAPTGGSGSPAYAAGDQGGNIQHGRRPVILNRPFRSLGELGYVFRDQPFKTLDFLSASSADAGLLDVFSLTDESKISANVMNSVVAGQVNLSNAPLPVLEALVSGGSKKDIDPTYNLGTESPSSVNGTSTSTFIPVSLGVANFLNPSGGPPNPLINRAALVTQVMPTLQMTKVTTGPAPFHIKTYTSISPFQSTADQGNKAYLESPIRALADVTNTRTWNLMIDIIAQSGQMSPTAKATDTNALSEFVVQGEKRYWLHIAIDRYTGKIVAQQLEPVYE